MKNSLLQLALVRHGQSQGNLAHVWHGAQTDAELTKLGEKQAKATGQYLVGEMPGVDVIYTSPLKRAKHTANIIAKSLGSSVEIVSDLIEIDWGDLEGLTTKQVAEKFPDVIRLWGTHLSSPLPGGEAASEVGVRVAKALTQIAENHMRDGKAVVVSHQGAITLGLGALLGDADGMLDYQPSNCGVMMMEFGKAPILKTSNYIQHLVSAGIETDKWLM